MDLSTPLYNYMSDNVILLTVFMFQVSQPYNCNVCKGVTSYSLDFHEIATLLHGRYRPCISLLVMSPSYNFET